MDDDDDVKPSAHGDLSLRKDRAQLALEPVASHGTLEATARSEANARPGPLMR